MTLVSHQPSLPLAGAVVRQLRRHMDGIGQGSSRNDQLGGHDQISALNTEECEAPTPPADILHTAKASNERVWNAKGFQHFPLLDHVALPARPRADRVSSAGLLRSASATKFRHTKVEPRGFRAVNAPAMERAS